MEWQKELLRQPSHCWRTPRITTYLFSPTEPHHSHGASSHQQNYWWAEDFVLMYPRPARASLLSGLIYHSSRKMTILSRISRNMTLIGATELEISQSYQTALMFGWQPTITQSQVELSHQLQLPVRLLCRHQVVRFDGIVVTSTSSRTPIRMTKKQANHRTESKHVLKQEHWLSLQTDCDWHPRKGRCSMNCSKH